MRVRRTTNSWWQRLRGYGHRASPSWPRVRRGAWVLLFAALLAGLLASNFLPGRLNIQVDQPAPRDIKAPRQFVDRPATEQKRQEAAARVADVYTQSPEVTEEVTSAVDSAFQEVRRIRRLGGDPETRAELVRRRLDLNITDETAVAVLRADAGTLQMLADGAGRVSRDLMGEGIKPERLEDVRLRVPEEVRALEFNRPHEAFVSRLVQKELRPNLFFDEQATQAVRQRAMEAVESEMILKDEILVREGERITEADLIRLREAGLLREEGPLPTLLGAAMLAVLLAGLTAAYVTFFNPGVASKESRIILLGLIALGTLLISRVVLTVSGYAIPVAAGAMLVSILIDARLAAFLAVLLAGTVALLAGGELQFFLVAVAGSLVGVFSVSRLGQRSDLMRAGFYVGIVNAGVVVLWKLLFGHVAIADMVLWSDVLWGLIGGFLSAVLTIGSLPFLESAFGIMTSVRLLELANPNQPLLRRLLVEAPGTYHHSIMVANLCEAAAEQVGADSLLARVGAYYHDVGKMKRPYFFIENQFGNVNPHDKIAPNLSALIITSHVKDGVEMARQYRLPQELRDFIREHHGTMTVEFFYNKAVNEHEGSGVLEENFRYPGPKPRSRETAIAMLADGAEATVRAMAKPTPGRIEATVRKMVRDRLNAGQLDHCDLTLADLNRIAETFAQVLSGIFHARVAYPETMMREIEEARKGERERRKEKGRTQPPPAAADERAGANG